MTAPHLLALNVGSTTLKGAAYTLDTAAATQPPRLQENSRTEVGISQGKVVDSLDLLLGRLVFSERHPDFIVHRVVHGGDLTGGHELDESLFDGLEALVPFAPFHQPATLRVARLAAQRWPGARQGVAFDTSFHASLADWSRRLPIPNRWHTQGVQRYGFHGLAFASALRKTAQYDASVRKGRVVLAHLGGGCSLCAVKEGVSVDTTMSVSPLGGVPGPSRCGDVDPTALLFILRRDNAGPEQVERQLMSESGLFGIAGSKDMRALIADSRPEAQLALELFTRRVAQSVAAMSTSIEGIDHLIFSGGIGQRSAEIRARVIRHLEWFGLRISAARNHAGEHRIDDGGRARVWVIAVDEERELAESVFSWI